MHSIRQYLRWLPAQLGLVNKGAFRLRLNGIYPDDVFLLSFPKSGNTWLRFILANLYASEKPVTLRNIDAWVPDVYTHYPTVNTMGPGRIIKVHHPYFRYFPQVIYIYRDYRDVLVSNWYRHKARLGYTASFGEYLRSGLYNSGMGSWRLHVQKALDFRKKSPGKIVLLRYEDLLDNPLPQIEKLVQFIGKKPLCDIHEAVQDSAFANLKAIETRFGSGYKDHTGEYFFRKGEQAQWKNYFTPADVQWLQQDQLTMALMEKLGYTQWQ